MASLLAGTALGSVDVMGSTNAALYRDDVFPNGTLFVGRSLTVAVLVGLAWVVLLATIGWARVRRRGIPLGG